MHCIKCGNYGKPGGCPSCGIDSDDKLKLDVMPNVDSFVKKTTFTKIPEQYIGVQWDKNKLLVQYDSLVGDVLFQRYIKSCDILHESFKSGNIINKSLFLCAPPLFGKEILVYSCMQYALKNNLKVAPYIDSMDLKRLIVLGAENPKYRVLNTINYDDYVTSDVVFVSITHTAYKSDSFNTILELLNKRSRLGLATFIISEVTVKELTKDMPDYVARRWSNPSDIGLSYLKYPVNVTFIPTRPLV